MSPHNDKLQFALMRLSLQFRFIQEIGNYGHCLYSRSSFLSSQIILSLLNTGEVYLTDLRKNHRSRTELYEPDGDEDGNEDQGQSNKRYAVHKRVGESSNLFFHRYAMSVARFDPSGKHVFVGTSGGYILAFHTRTKTVRGRYFSDIFTIFLFQQLVARHRIAGGAGTIKGLDFAKNGR